MNFTPRLASQPFRVFQRKSLKIFRNLRQNLDPHARARRWLLHYFSEFREEADLAARCGGGSLPSDAFSYEHNAELLPALRRAYPILRKLSEPEMQETLHELDAEFKEHSEGTVVRS